MNQNNRKLELSTNRLALMLESLEEYIRHADIITEWKNKEQFFRRTIGDSNKWDLDNDEDHFFSNLYITKGWFKDESENIRKETQKEFYKWIDYSRITAENCPERLKYHLNEINETLEGRGDNFEQAYQEANKEFWELLKEEVPVFWQAGREVSRFFFGEPIPYKPKKIRDVIIKGNAEQGQKTFQQIKNSIVSQPEWTFPWKEKYFRKLKEKVKELEGKKDQPQPKQISPKEVEKSELIPDTFDDILRDVELYIQKLDYYPNWKVREWKGGSEDYLLKNWENSSLAEIKDKVLQIDFKCLFLVLKAFKEKDLNYYPNLVSELKVKFLSWQSERVITTNNCPEQLKEVLFTINEVLEGSWDSGENKKDKGNNEDEQEEIIKIIAELRLKINELTKKYKITGLDSNWRDRLMNMKTLSEVKSYQQQIEQKIQAEKTKHPTTTNENKLSLPAKVVIGAWITGLVLGTIILVGKKSKKTSNQLK